jgi:DNA-binding beta-propeller fold protein YncE
MLYASVPGTVPTYGNSVVTIDPATGAITGSVFVGSDPGVVAISDDGQVLYVALGGSQSIRRVSLSPLAAGLEFPLDFPASDLSVMPGRSGTLAAALYHPGISPSHAGVCLYDNGVRRAQCTPGHIGSNVIEFGDEGEVIYGSDTESSAREFTSIGVLANGLEKTRVTRDLAGGSFMRYAAGRIYFESGSVIDGGRHARVGNLAGGGIMAPDPALGRVFAIAWDQSLTVYDMNNFTSLGSVPLPNFGVGLVRWGNGGLAYRDQDKVYIVLTPLAAP